MRAKEVVGMRAKEVVGMRAKVHLPLHTAPELWPEPFIKCCFTSAETIRMIRGGEPRTA